MQRFFKIIFWAAIGFIATTLVIAGLLHVFPIEFATSGYEDDFDALLLLGLPIAIIFTLTGTIKRTNNVGEIIAKIVLTLFVAFLPVLFAFTTALDLCGWSTSKVLFEKRDDTSAKIILREFGCGAVDSSSPDYKVVKIKHITPLFIYITDIDTTKIDKTGWRRVDN